MNHVFWIGVFPGLTNEMLDFIGQSMTQFANAARAGLQIV